MRAVVVLMVLVASAWAQDTELERPSELRQRLQGRRPIMRPSPEQRGIAKAFVAKWDKASAQAEEADRSDLAVLRVWAGQVDRGLADLLALATDAAGRMEYAHTVSICFRQLPEAKLAEARVNVEAMAKAAEQDEASSLSMLWQSVVRLAHRQGDAAATLKACREAIDAAPSAAAVIARYAIAAHMTGVHEMDGYPQLRKRIAKMLAEYKDVATRSPNGRRFAMMERLVERMLARSSAAVELLGRPAPAWTVAHEFRGPSDLAVYRGKVTLLYFWQTSQDDSVRGLAVLRDLAERYKDKPFAIVLVTWPGFAVYPARFDLDADIDKPIGPEHEPARINVRERDQEKVTRFHDDEKKTIAAFLKNHELPWPALMIPVEEVGKQCGGLGLPSTLLLDGEGRVRYIKPAALRRGSRIAEKEIPEVIEALLESAR